MSKKKSNGHAKNGTTREGVERRRYITSLPVPADPKTISKASANFARLVSEEETLQEERRDAMAGFKSRKNAIDESMRGWRDTVEKGTQLAAVEVVETLVVETNEVQVKRLDTGEIIETRAAEASDRQEQLDLDAMPAKDRKAVQRAAEKLGRARAVPDDLWAVSSGDKLSHHFASGEKVSACGLPYVGAPALTPAAPDAPTCKECSAKRTTIGAAVAKSKRGSKTSADEVKAGLEAEEAAAEAVAKKGTAASRKKRGGKTTVVAGADAE